MIAAAVADLESQARPVPLGQRRTLAERRLYRVRARLVGAQVGQGGEIELVLADLRNGATITAGLPDEQCTRSAPSPRRASMASARAAFLQRCGAVSGASLVRLRGVVTVTGVGFFAPAGAADVARNGFGLKPVLRFAAGSCARAHGAS